LVSLRSYLSAPLPQEVIEEELKARSRGKQTLVPRGETELQAALRRGEALRAKAPRGFAADFERLDEMVARHRAGALQKYAEMVGEHARANLGRRTQDAQEVVSRWKGLDAELLESTPEGANMAALLSVDDATYARAQGYSLRSAGQETVALVADLKDVHLRVLCAPPRVFWMKRVTRDLTRSTRNLLGREIASEFIASESALRDFEEAARRRTAAMGPAQKALTTSAAVLGACSGLPLDGIALALGLESGGRSGLIGEPDVASAFRALPGACDAGLLERARRPLL
jgi:hypothetical protein